VGRPPSGCIETGLWVPREVPKAGCCRRVSMRLRRRGALRRVLDIAWRMAGGQARGAAVQRCSGAAAAGSEAVGEGSQDPRQTFGRFRHRRTSRCHGCWVTDFFRRGQRGRREVSVFVFVDLGVAIGVMFIIALSMCPSLQDEAGMSITTTACTTS
jgi:hypothetical protein